MAITISTLQTSGQTNPNTSTPQVFEFGSLTFTVAATATGGVPITYLWQVSSNGGATWFDLPNNGGTSITVTNWSVTQNGDLIRVVLTANSGPGGTQETIRSDEEGFARTVTVLQAPIIVFTPDLDSQANYVVAAGGSISITLDATVISNQSQFSNSDPANIDTELVFTWQVSTDNGVNFNTLTLNSNAVVNNQVLGFGQTPEVYYKRSILTLNNVLFSQNNYRYRCLVSYSKGGINASNSPIASNSIRLVVNPQIIITRQPGEQPGPDTTTTVSYNASIPGSGIANFSIVAYTTATTPLTFKWQYTIDGGITFNDFDTVSPYLSGGSPGLNLFRLVSGTTPFSSQLLLERMVIDNNPNAASPNRYGFRAQLTGSSGEIAVTSSTAYVDITQSISGLITDPIDQSVVEDKYGDIANRATDFDEPIQRATFSAAVDIYLPNGLRGTNIVLQWQRKRPATSSSPDATWVDVGVPKVVSGQSAVNDGTDASFFNQGAYDYVTPAVRRDLDHLSQYRLSITYSPTSTTRSTIFSNPATLSVFRTVYIDAQPASVSVYNNQSSTFAVIASPSSGSTLTYQWQESANGLDWFDLSNTTSQSVQSLTRVDYIATLTTATAHGFVAGDQIFIEDAFESAYNGRFTVLSTGLTSNTLQYRMYSIPSVSPATGPVKISRCPTVTGATTSLLVIRPSSDNIARRFFRCVLNTSDSLSSVQSASGVLTLLADTFFQISNINDRIINQFNSNSWTVVANSLSLSPPYYQWQRNPTTASSTSTAWTDIVGENTDTLTLNNVQPSNAGFYRCKLISAGFTESRTNAARLQVIPVNINIKRNIPTLITALEGNTTTSFTVEAYSSTGSIVEYLWEIKRTTDADFQPAPAGFNQTSSTFAVYNLAPPNRLTDHNAIIRCRMNAAGVPGFTYSNECTIRVDRRFYYFADAATKNVVSGTEVELDLNPSFTGSDLPSYQWERRINSGASWVSLPGETSPSLTIPSSQTPNINGYQYRCQVTLPQVTTFQYFRNFNTTIQNINPAGTTTPTQIITINLTSGAPNISFYTKQKSKIGAAIGTVICVPKPASYINDPSSNFDDITGWRVAITGQTTTGAPAQGVSNNTRPGGPNDRFPGYIEMRGQILRARDYPELARILGTTYGGTITGTYPTYSVNDTFRLPCPYGMKLMGTGNVDNNRASPSIVPLYGPDSISGGNIFTAGSMGGEYNFEKIPQLPPGSPGDGSGADGVSSDTFTIGVHRTDGWENCTATVNTDIVGQFTWSVSDSAGIAPNTIGLPVHFHNHNAIIANNGSVLAPGNGSPPTFNRGGSCAYLSGPGFIASNQLGREHQHGLSFEAGTVVFTPPSSGGGGGGGGGGDVNFTSPGTYTFTLPSNVTSFQYSLTSASGGGGGNDSIQRGGAGGNGGQATGTINNIPGGTTIEIKIGNGGAGGAGSRSSAPGGAGGNSFNTGFGAGTGGSAGPQGSSGGGGGGGGASLMYIKTLGSGANPQGLQVGTILVIVGGGGGGPGAGWYGGVLRANSPGGSNSGSWASSSINSASFYDNQSALDFKDYSQTLSNSGKNGTNKSGDGGGGGGGGGGFTGGAGGGVNSGDSHGLPGAAGTNAYRAANHSGTPTVSPSGTPGQPEQSGSGGSASIFYSGAAIVPPSNPGGINSPDHGTGIGSSGAAFLTETVDVHFNPTSTSPSLGVSIIDGEAAMSIRSRTPWDAAHTFYLRNNEVCPMVQPYFRLKYLIKAF